MRRAAKRSWTVLSAAPPREVFAVMEQLTGSFPYRFEVLGAHEARMVEAERRGFFGQWTYPRRHPAEVRCSAIQGETGTQVLVTASAGRPSASRAEQLVQLLKAGNHDPRTIYRERLIPAGPVTLVASWAGMSYRLYEAADHGAARGPAITTATPMEALCAAPGPWCWVRLGDGSEGYVEKDQLVAAPAIATRRAQSETARFV